jgi:hypothetical protein
MVAGEEGNHGGGAVIVRAVVRGAAARSGGLALAIG